jgi:excinuclease UvrABC nuclease subunit
MYVDKYSRTWIGPFPFTESAVEQNAPTSSGVYQILLQGQVVYIGISTTSIRDRLRKHVKGHGNWAAARRSPAAGYEFVYFLCDGKTAKQIESNVITLEKPPYNVKPEYKNFIESITVH